MSLALKFQQGGTTPTTYSFYGKLYDYNDLAKAADQGLNTYLSNLKRGEKDEADFRNAYLNIMSGIKDGSITFEDGHFHDKQGRYTNSDKKNKDYYGLIANYIYNNMGKSDEYKAPEDTTKIKWDSDSVKKALMKQLFNNDTGNIQDFLDLDEAKDGVRGVTNRASYLSNAFQNIADNWDNTFSGYSDTDKLQYLNLLTNAAQALRDGTIDAGDYLALSKAVGGMDFRSMLSTGQSTATTPSIDTSTSSALDSTSEAATSKMKNASLVDTSYDSNSINKMSSILQNVKSENLISVLRNSFYNPNYKIGNDRRVLAVLKSNNISSKAGVNATLNALYAQHALVNAGLEDPNVFYIPGLRTKLGTGWVWNRAKNTVTEMKISDIPAAAKHFGVLSAKHGGVLKAQQGVKINPFLGVVDYDPKNYKTTYGNVLAGINDKGIYGNPYGNNGIGAISSRYNTDSNYSDYTDKGKTYATNVENQQYYRDFSDALTSDALKYLDTTDKSGINESNNIFYRWAKSYDKSLPTGSTASFFDTNGKLRTLWTNTNKDSYMRGPNDPTTNLIDRLKAIRNDLLIANGHNDYLKEGTRYFYKDANGVQHWVDPEVAYSGKFTVSKNGIKTRDGNVDWTDYELTAPTSTNTNTSNNTGLTGTGSDINTRTPANKESWWNTKGRELVKDIAPYAVGASRLANSIYTNNRIAKEVKLSIKPVLRNDYELYSPVTGDFATKQFYNQQAAELRLANNQAHGADQDRNLLSDLMANKEANNLEERGHMADNDRIFRTQQQAFLLAADNKKRRTDTANYNSAAINQANREIAQIEANRLKSNWQGLDNFQAGIESDIRQQRALDKYDQRVEQANNRYRSLSLDTDSLDREYKIKLRNIENKYQDLKNDAYNEYLIQLKKWQDANGDASYIDLPFYKDYVAKIRLLRDLHDAETDQLAELSSKAQKAFIENLRLKMYKTQYNKNGGKLSMSSIALLNKIMS